MQEKYNLLRGWGAGGVGRVLLYHLVNIVNNRALYVKGCISIWVDLIIWIGLIIPHHFHKP